MRRREGGWRVSNAGKPRATWLREQFLFAKAHQTWSPWGAFNLHVVKNPGPLQPSFSGSSQAPQPQVHALSIASFPCGPSAARPGSHHLPALSPTLTSFPFFPPSRHTHTVPTSLRPDLCLFSSVHAKSRQSCPALCHPMDCSLPGSSVHGILQTRILEWVAILFSRGSSRSRDRTHISCSSCITGGFFTTEPPGFPKTPLPVLGPPTPLVYVTSLPPGSSL